MIIGGMEWAVAQGADVISMSLGSNGAPAACNDPMSSAAQELATTSSSLFVIAAGNTGSANNTVSAPGCAPAVLTIGAVDRQDVPAWFSSRGPTAVDHNLKPEMSAPGVGISAARSGGRGDNAYAAMSGTSMATPHVAGAAAIVKQAHPTWTGQQLKAALVSSAKSDVPGDVRAQGAGRLDVIAAAKAPVTTMPVQGGTFAWPHTSAQVTTIDVPYTNVTDKPVRLQLSVAGVTGDDGSAVKSAPVVLGASSVTVPAGSTVKVPLKIDPTAKLGGRAVRRCHGPHPRHRRRQRVDALLALRHPRDGEAHGSGEGPPRQPGQPGFEHRRGQHRLLQGPARLQQRRRGADVPGASRHLLPVELRQDPGPRLPDRGHGRLHRLLRSTGGQDHRRHDRRLRRDQGTPAVGQDGPAQRGEGERPLVLPHLGRHVDPLRLPQQRPDDDRRVCRRAGQRQGGHLGVR